MGTMGDPTDSVGIPWGWKLMSWDHLMGMETDARVLQWGCKRIREMKTHFTIMLILWCLQWLKQNPLPMAFESNSHNNVK